VEGAVRTEFFSVITSRLFLEKDKGCSDRRQPYIYHCLPCVVGYTAMLANVYFRD
jgi:hypothetical protein